MALPLILGAAGLLASGGQYLLSRADEREAQQQQGALEQFAMSPQGRLYDQVTMGGVSNAVQAGNQIAQGGGFFDTDRADQIGALTQVLRRDFSQFAMQDYATTRAQQFQQARDDRRFAFDVANENWDRQQDVMDRRFDWADELRAQASEGRADFTQVIQAQNDIRQGIQRVEQQFHQRQGAIRQGADLLLGEEGQRLGGAQLYGAVYSALKAMMPTEAVMAGDTDAMIEAGGLQGQIGRFLNFWTGKDLAADTADFRRDALELVRAINEENNRGYKGVVENALNRADDYRRQGIGVGDVHLFNYGLPDYYEVPRMGAPATVTDDLKDGDIVRGPNGQDLVIGSQPNRRRR